jgi:hypothetical protein
MHATGPRAKPGFRVPSALVNITYIPTESFVSTTRREIAVGDAGSLSEGSLIFTLPFFHMLRDKHTRIP